MMSISGLASSWQRQKSTDKAASRNDPAQLSAAYVAVRSQTMRLIDGLTPEDCLLQSMADASPVKWHLAHVTWFFEVFVLASIRGLPGYQDFDPAFRVLFNSYYEGVGARHPRPERGMLSRPPLDQVLRYRRHVDAHILELLADDELAPELRSLVELGLHHEQQHQELILTDLKHHFSRNPVAPAYREPGAPRRETPPPLAFVEFTGGLAEIGHAGGGFAFDNESPRHRVWLEPYALANRPVTHGEYIEFIHDGGYRRPDLWLSDGWDTCQREQWQAPLYWRREGPAWRQFTLHGMADLDMSAPVCHLSYYEADAYARWAGGRLPTEAEWEHAVQTMGNPEGGNFLENELFHPRCGMAGEGLRQMFGDVWEWTQSAYLPYPGFRPAPGAVGEYNGKFMINQMVLRGGSCATPRSHLRPSYRNFFPPQARWQFSGLRLAR